MKQAIHIILFVVLIMLVKPLFTQIYYSTNDTIKKVDNKPINISKTKTSNVIWERVDLPEGKELSAFEITPSNELYIGCDNGGVFKYIDGDWQLIGLDSNTIYDFEEYTEDKIIICSNNLFSWDNTEVDLLAESFYPKIKKVYNYYFGYNSFSSLYRSTDDCYTWDEVYYIPVAQGETIKSIASTNNDSVFMGTTDFLGINGGIYLSSNNGDNWEPFGLYQHFIASLAIDNYNHVYAGNNGHYETGQGGLYRLNYATNTWNTIFYFPYITTIVFNTENHIYTGFNTSEMGDYGGVMHSEDNGETWVLDTIGIGSTYVNELQIDNNGFLYALTGYSTKKLFRSCLPVSINPKDKRKDIFTQVFPNPSKDKIQITFSSIENAQSIISLQIFNTEGRMLITRQISSTEAEKGMMYLDISHLENGYYFYSISNNTFKVFNKFIKD